MTQRRSDVLGKVSAEFVETLVEWDGQPGRVFSTAIELGWLEIHSDGWITAHGWNEYNAELSRVPGIVRDRSVSPSDHGEYQPRGSATGGAESAERAGEGGDRGRKIEPELERKPQFAKRASVSIRSVDNWINDRMIPYLKVGRTVLIPWREALETLNRDYKLDPCKRR